LSKGSDIQLSSRSSRQLWVILAFVFVGTLGVTFAVTGAVSALPKPSAGGTCGPGRDSEAAIVALFNPASIGAGPEPPPADAGAHAQWLAFVNECQSAADDRGVAASAILLVSIGIATAGSLLVLRASRRRGEPSTPGAGVPQGDDGTASPPAALA
jgi:hypothetical protein